MSNRDFELDDILSEFKGYADGEEPVIPAEEPAAPEELPEEPFFTEAVEDERPEISEETAEELEDYDPFAAIFGDKTGREPAESPAAEASAPAPAPYDTGEPGREYGEEALYEDKAPYAERAETGESAGRQPIDFREILLTAGDWLHAAGLWLRDRWDDGAQRIRAARENRGGQSFEMPQWLSILLNVALLILTCLCAAWVFCNVHPGSGTVVKGTPSINLAARVAPETAAGETAVEGETQTKKHWIIEEHTVVAPPSDPANFGSISISEPEKVQDLIRQARESGLLGEDETVAFDPNVNFYHDTEIEYYLDDTILVLCWKEVIDGNTCSFAEIKIADASQFRRKFADDTFASANQYYSSELHKSTNAVISLNADFYQNRDFGVVVYDRELYRFPTGTYTGTYKKYNCLETCFVDSKGNFLFTDLGQTFTQEELKQYIADNDILFSISFGPVLVRDGQVQQIDWYPVGEISRGYSRAGIGQVDELHYLYMSLNHSAEREARWSVNQFAQHFGEKPVRCAYCLDGGQTSEIVFRDRPFNYIDFGKERPVSDNIFFATAIGGTEVSR